MAVLVVDVVDVDVFRQLCGSAGASSFHFPPRHARGRNPNATYFPRLPQTWIRIDQGTQTDNLHGIDRATQMGSLDDDAPPPPPDSDRPWGGRGRGRRPEFLRQCGGEPRGRAGDSLCTCRLNLLLASTTRVAAYLAAAGPAATSAEGAAEASYVATAAAATTATAGARLGCSGCSNSRGPFQQLHQQGPPAMWTLLKGPRPSAPSSSYGCCMMRRSSRCQPGGIH